MQMYDVYLILPNYLARKTDIFLVLTKKTAIFFGTLKIKLYLCNQSAGRNPVVIVHKLFITRLTEMA